MLRDSPHPLHWDFWSAGGEIRRAQAKPPLHAPQPYCQARFLQDRGLYG
jgi:hypothetical protein